MYNCLCTYIHVYIYVYIYIYLHNYTYAWSVFIFNYMFNLCLLVCSKNVFLSFFPDHKRVTPVAGLYIEAEDRTIFFEKNFKKSALLVLWSGFVSPPLQS